MENKIVQFSDFFENYSVEEVKKISELIQQGRCDCLNIFADQPPYFKSNFSSKTLIVREDIFGGRYMAYFGLAIDHFIKKTIKPFYFKMFSVMRYLEKQKNVDHICFSEEGFDLMRNGAIGIDALSRSLSQPSILNSSKIGRGSEGDCYFFELSGIKMVIKIFNEETQKRLDQFLMMFRMEYDKPVFSERIGFCASLVKDMEGFPKRKYIVEPVKEYWASRNCIVTKYCSPISVRDLLVFSGLDNSNIEIGRENLKSFVKKYRITKASLKKLKSELNGLRDIAIVQKILRLGFIGKNDLQADFSYQNFMVRSYDRASNIYDLVLIDQGQSPARSTMDPYYQEFEDCRYAFDAYKRLIRKPTFKDWLKKNIIKEKLNEHKRKLYQN